MDDLPRGLIDNCSRGLVHPFIWNELVGLQNVARTAWGSLVWVFFHAFLHLGVNRGQRNVGVDGVVVPLVGIKHLGK
jgi:hypothetical protein